MVGHLLSFGHGYSAQALTKRLLPLGWEVTGTTRNPEKAKTLSDLGVNAILWNSNSIDKVLEKASAILVSIGPEKSGDPVIERWGSKIIECAQNFSWVGYLSTTSVYGDHKGEWVDENTTPEPTTERGKRRLSIENQWQNLGFLPIHIFRLAGIYGPERTPLTKVRDGKAQRIKKPGQFFSRIHVEDIANVLKASLEAPNPGSIYNVCDDCPAPPQDVIGYAYELLALKPPPEINFEVAKLSEMAKSFYSDSKKVRNEKIKRELRVQLNYPNYKVGLNSMKD